MVDRILQWLLDLISNPLFVMGLVFIFIASFLKDEKMVDAGKLKPASILKKTLRPLPVWAYTLMIGTGILITVLGVLQIGGMIGLVTDSAASAPDRQGVLRLEKIPFWAFSYGFGKDFIAPQHFSTLVIVNDADSTKDYKLSFSMPMQGDAAAGLSFTLAEPFDLSSYSDVGLMARFTNSSCDLYMKDIHGASSFVTISSTAPASMQPAWVNGMWRLKIPLTNFNSMNQQVVKEIGCNAQRCEGQQCTIELSGIQFSKR